MVANTRNLAQKRGRTASVNEHAAGQTGVFMDSQGNHILLDPNQYRAARALELMEPSSDGRRVRPRSNEPSEPTESQYPIELGSSPPSRRPQGTTQLIEQETQERGEDGDLDNELPEEEEEEQEFEFDGNWKAVIAQFKGKEIELPGMKADRWSETTLTARLLEDWRYQSEALYSGPLELNFRLTRAVISHSKARSVDERRVDIVNEAAMAKVIDLLKKLADDGREPVLHVTSIYDGVIKEPTRGSQTPARSRAGTQAPASRGSQTPRVRQTTTNRQLNALPGELQAEDAAGNPGCEISSRWVCRQKHFGSRGLCWVKGDGTEGAQNNVSNHFPVSGEMMRKWAVSTANGESTVETPGPNIVAALVMERQVRETRSKDVNERRKESSSTSSSSKENDKIMNTYLKMKLADAMKPAQQTPYPPWGYPLPSHLGFPPAGPSTSPIVIGPAVTPSSPVRSNSSPEEVLQEFFDWYTRQYAPKQVEYMQDICKRLVTEDWALDHLRTPKKGGSERLDKSWNSYGFREGTLEKLREKISDFKKQRGDSGGSSTESEGDESQSTL
jgi:hypothetical protein